MAGTFVVQTDATFATAILMQSEPKMAFGSQAQDTNAAGLPKWTVNVAVTFTSEPGMRAQSEVISVTIAAAADPVLGVPPGTAVMFEGFRVGASTPEKNDRGGIRGGKLWYTAAALRPVHSGRGRTENAA
jgi:hypothetical protein